MNNNDIVRRLRFAFDLTDDQMMKLFKNGGYKATRAEVSDWLKKEDDPAFKTIIDLHLAIFLNGFIVEKRGKKEGEEPIPEKKMNNNLVLRKLKIALNLNDTDMMALFDLVGFRLSKHELSAFFRNPANPHYRPCKDQILRNFLVGLQMKYRPKTDDTDDTD
ncbi:YehS family protein [Arundinibacter roseus]|uniref:DUF1456 family protein n=1 Tax=Arundinibacter roseus TaxID=2070510 RepID=A0A4R4KGE9_9BACT|nr:DUF1456 family protein [Arundinibacter roseus]TDB65946.1 DUF1456 family protein [Arundinibacter roseus]